MIFFKPKWIRGYRVEKQEFFKDGVLDEVWFVVYKRKVRIEYFEWDKVHVAKSFDGLIGFFKKTKADWYVAQKTYVKRTRISISEILKAVEKI